MVDGAKRDLDDAIRVAFELVDAEAEADAAERARRVVEAVGVRTVVNPGPDTRGAASTEPASEPSDRYEMKGELGRGGVGVVLEGTDRHLGRDVAIKLLHERHASDPDLVRRFVEEAKVGGQLQHPGIVPVHDMGTFDAGRPFFTMKLVKGDTLAVLLKRRASPDDDRARFFDIFQKICQTMAYAHARGVIHRDLKPANIMVGKFGEVQVMDWGLAKVLEASDLAPPRDDASETLIDRTRSGDESGSVVGAVMGTPAYMAPEQARGELGEIDRRSDVFALGAILCEIITGSAAHPGANAVDACLRAARGEIEGAVERIGVSIADPEIKRLAIRCLSPERRERPADAEAVADAVTAYLASVQSRLRAAELRATRARARFVAAVAVAAAIVMTGAGYFYMESSRRARVRRIESSIREAEHKSDRAERMAREGNRGHLAAWAAAVSEAEHARELARSRGISDAVRSGVRARAARVARAAAEARRREEHRARDQRMAERVERIRLEPNPLRPDVDTRGERFAAAFREYGLDVLAGSPDAAAAKIRASSLADVLVASVDLWSFIADDRGERDSYGRLARIALAAEPDRRGREIRQRLYRAGRDEVRRLAGELEPSRVPGRIVLYASWRLARFNLKAESYAVLKRAQLAHPGDFWILQSLVSLGRLLNRKHDVVRYSAAALALKPESPSVMVEHAMVLREAGALDDAETLALRAIRLAPDSHVAHQALGLALIEKGDARGGTDALRRAVSLRPDLAQPHVVLATTLDRLERPGDAAASFQEALRIQPGYWGAHFGLGRTWWSRGDFEAAVREYRRALECFRRDHRGDWLADAESPAEMEGKIHWYLGHALLRKGDPAGAIEALRDAVATSPNDGDLYVDLAKVLSERADRPDEAITLLEKAVDVDPSHWRARFNLAACYFRAGDAGATIACLRAAIRLKPDLVQAHIGLSDALLLQARYAEALAAVRRATELSLDPARRQEVQARIATLERQLAFADLLDDGNRHNAVADRHACLGRIAAAHADERYLEEVLLWDTVLLEAREESDRCRCRWRAAEAAVMAATGRGRAAPRLDAAARSRLRLGALAWLRANLTSWDRRFATQRSQLRRRLDRLLTHPAFEPIRAESAVQSFEPREREAVRRFWGEVRTRRKESEKR